ncbi:hypothetical protein TNCV_4883741 [Trichonephila clavipes]|nr:hypothetical protein TNCV_4883741 [Trichonephila clavipes]
MSSIKTIQRRSTPRAKQYYTNQTSDRSPISHHAQKRRKGRLTAQTHRHAIDYVRASLRFRHHQTTIIDNVVIYQGYHKQIIIEHHHPSPNVIHQTSSTKPHPNQISVRSCLPPVIQD